MVLIMAVYRALLRAAVAVDNAPELLPIVRTAVAPVLQTPLSRSERLTSATCVVRARFRSSAAPALASSAQHFHLLKILRSAVQQHHSLAGTPVLYRADAASGSQLLLVVAGKAIVINTHWTTTSFRTPSTTSPPTGRATPEPATLLQLCKRQVMLDPLHMRSAGQATRSLRHLSKCLPVLDGGDMAVPSPFLVHTNPLVAEMVHAMMSPKKRHQQQQQQQQEESSAACSNTFEDAPVFVNDLRHVLLLPPHVVTTLSASNCRAFSSHASRELHDRVLSHSPPLSFLNTNDVIIKCLFTRSP